MKTGIRTKIEIDGKSIDGLLLEDDPITLQQGQSSIDIPSSDALTIFHGPDTDADDLFDAHLEKMATTIHVLRFVTEKETWVFAWNTFGPERDYSDRPSSFKSKFIETGDLKDYHLGTLSDDCGALCYPHFITRKHNIQEAELCAAFAPRLTESVPANTQKKEEQKSTLKPRITGGTVGRPINNPEETKIAAKRAIELITGPQKFSKSSACAQACREAKDGTGLNIGPRALERHVNVLLKKRRRN